MKSSATRPPAASACSRSSARRRWKNRSLDEAREVVAARGGARPPRVQQVLDRHRGVRGEDLQEGPVALVERAAVQAVHHLQNPAHAVLDADRDRQEAVGAEGVGLVEAGVEVGVVVGVGDQVGLAVAVHVPDDPLRRWDAGAQQRLGRRAERGDEVERGSRRVAGPLERVVEQHRACLRRNERVGPLQHLLDETGARPSLRGRRCRGGTARGRSRAPWPEAR